jgi:hypothetical protein
MGPPRAAAGADAPTFFEMPAHRPPSEPSRASGEEAAWLAVAGQVRAEAEALLALAGGEHAETLRRLVADPDADTLAASGTTADASPDREARFSAALTPVLRELGPLALKAALAAIRAGAAARGFAAAAREGAALDGLRRAWDDIEPSVEALEEQAAETASLAAALHGLEPLADGGPAAGSRGVARRIAAAADRIETLRAGMARTTEALAGRLASAAAAPTGADRRAGHRFPFRNACQLLTAREALAGRTVDISPKGALVSITPRPDLPRGQPVSLVLRDVGAIAGVVAGVSASGVHLAFDLGHAANAASGRALLPVLAGLAHENEAMVAGTQALAAALTEALGAAVETGSVALEALLPPDPSQPAAAAPTVDETAVSSFHERLLSPLLVRALDGDVADEAAAFDRTGRLRAHAAVAGHEPVGRDAPEDWPLLQAALNLRPSLVQVYPDPGGPHPHDLVKDVSAPVFVRGRHWGCARLLRRFADPAS